MKEILIPLNFTTTPTVTDTKQSFSTSDEASGVLTFTTTADVAGTVASLTIRNASENANRQTVLIERLDVNSSPFSYALKNPLPFGQYEGTVLLKKNLTVIASATFLFGVNSSLSAEVLPDLVKAYSLAELVENVETEVSNLKDAYNLTVSETVKGVNKTESTLQAQENVRYLNEHTRKTNEESRIANEQARIAAELLRKDTFDTLVDSAVIEETVAQEVANEFQQIESTYANRLLSTEQQLEHKAEQTALAVEKARIDNLSKMAEGSTTGDAELIDGRVGADAVVYPNIGGNIRKQGQQTIKLLGSEYINFTKGYNIALGSVPIGGTVNLTPEAVAFYGHAIVDCRPGDTFMITATGGANPRTYGFIDENSKLISMSTNAFVMIDALLVAPEGADRLIINSDLPKLGACFKNVLGVDFKNLRDELQKSISIEQAQREIEYLTGSLNQILIDADKPLTIQAPYKYTAWPFISSVGDKMICVYARSLSHEDSTSADMYSRVSLDGGKSWTAENKIIGTPNVRDTITGKGKDANGKMVVWNRVGPPGEQATRHHLYVTTDGINFTVVSKPTFSVVPGHIGDIFAVPTVGLIAFYNTFGTSRSWGIVKSADNGLTWTQHGVENGITADECPTEISGTYLQDGKIIAIGRKDTGDGTVAMFQIESSDYGVTWSKNYTNITDIGLSTPSLIYDEATDLLHLYYFHRGPGILRLRKSTASSVWGSPLSWTVSQEIAQGTTNFQDTGNANAALFNGVHVVTYYSGDATNTGIYAKIVTP